MSQVHSFPPISDEKSRVLILGSMPGKVSLQESQYYAHPRNLFWRFMDELLGIPRNANFDTRCSMLRERNVALWDVLQTCTRSSSLDSDIVESSIVPNDFARFFQAHPRIELVCFNGAKSEKIFEKHVAPNLGSMLGHRKLIRLPSTSPANASISFAVKLDHWRAITG